MRNATQTERQKDNLENAYLTRNMHVFFYSERRHPNGLYTGGREKYKAIRGAQPPIELAEPGSPLDTLFKRAFVLLRMHYNTVDLDHLTENYSATPPSPRHRRTNNRAKNSTPTADLAPDSALEILNFEAPRTANSESRLLSSVSSSASSGSIAGPPTPPPLNDHRAIMQLFAYAFYTDQGEPIATEPFWNDKLYDQFDGACATVEKRYSSSSQPSNKRKAGDSDPNPRPKKTPSHVRRQGNFDSTSLEPQQESSDEDKSDSGSETDSNLSSTSDSNSDDES